MRTYGVGMSDVLDLRKGLDALPELTRRFHQHDRFGRRVRSTADGFSLTALREWNAVLAKDWRLVLDRLIRIRNALAHGGPIGMSGMSGPSTSRKSRGRCAESVAPAR
jgi:hypothetical protein